MQYDLGFTGLGLLVVMSLGFGVIAHLVAGRDTRWMWLIGAMAYFVGGLFVSEVMFATYTVNEIQPIIDGLAFDEALLISLVPGIVVVALAWFVKRQAMHRPAWPQP